MRIKLKLLTGNRAEWEVFGATTSNGAGVAREWKFQKSNLMSDVERPADIREAWKVVQD